LRSLKRVYGVYGALVISFVVIVFVPVYFIVFLLTQDQKLSDVRGHSVSRFASRVLFFLLGIRTKVFNSKILKDKAYVFVANHASLLDIPAVVLATNHTFKFLAKAELTKVPLFGYIIRKLYLSVQRGSRDDRARSMLAMSNCLHQGVSIFIYPEGTRNKTPEPLQPLYDGAFRLSLETQIPIAVATIIGSRKLLNGTELQPGTIKIYWQGIVTPSRLDNVETLKEKTRELLLQGLRQS
jgi:1-acyl-sn-glycerol-3-phosphate acyltransferase